MAITGSPDIYVIEEDLSTYISTDSVTTAALVGEFEWGPVEKVTQITSIGDLVDVFGKPTDYNYVDWYSARNYLNYSGSLSVVRVTQDNRSKFSNGKTYGTNTQRIVTSNANDKGYTPETRFSGDVSTIENEGILFRNEDDFTNRNSSISTNQYTNTQYATFIARYPGVKGNNIHVSVMDSDGYEFYKNQVDPDEIDESTGKNKIGKKELSNEAFDIGYAECTDAQSKKEFLSTHIRKNYLYRLVKNNLVNLPSNNYVAVAIWDDENNAESSTPSEVGVYSFKEGNTDITGYDNYLFTALNNSSNLIYIATNNSSDFKKACRPVGIKNGDEYTVLSDADGDEYTFSLFSKTLSGGTGGEENGSNSKLNFEGYPITVNGNTTKFFPKTEAYERGWDLFANSELEDSEIDLLIQGNGDIEIGNYMIELAEARGDCIACVSPMISEVVNKTSLEAVNSLTASTGSGNLTSSDKSYKASSYVFMDGNYKYQYDSYNSVYRWLPLNADVAGLFAEIDKDEYPWFSIGDHQIQNCVKLAYYPTKAQRDILYNYCINPITSFKSEGNVVWGDWTRVSSTAFNFIGVRRLFLYLERNIKKYARTIMWKQNDSVTADTFRDAVTPFLDEVQAARGIQEYGVYCGPEITTDEEMDKGIFKAKIIVKPIRSIRYIELTFSAIRSDMSIEEAIS